MTITKRLTLSILLLAATIFPTVQAESTMNDSLFTIPFKTITGDTASLADFKGKVLLVVNVASECGHTPQYEGLEKLYEKYKDKGLVVIGFPANDFDGQEPGTNEQILHFCKSKYGVQFPMMSKIKVLGDAKHLLYEYLTTHAKPAGEVEWNFEKFLIARDGTIAARYNKRVKPDDENLVGKVEELLEENPKSEIKNQKSADNNK
jgi:glutathione peroxidase